MAALLVPCLVGYGEFVNLPDRPAVDLELHFGQVIEMGRPTLWHLAPQHHSEAAGGLLDLSWQVLIKAPYRALAEYEALHSIVVVVSGSRWNAAVAARWLMGSPEVVIEVLAPSNTKGEMAE